MKRQMLALLVFAAVASPETVSLTLAPSLNERTVLIEGTTSLGDGALICWEVDEGTKVTVQSGKMAEGCTPVKHNSYRAVASVAGWPKGKITVWAAFMTILAPQSQPAWVLKRYGNDGNKLTGGNVTRHGKPGDQLRTIEVEKTLFIQR